MNGKDLYIVGIGASAGGLDSLKSFFSCIPDNPGMSFVVLMHLPKDYESILDKILGKVTPLPVTMLDHTTAVQPDHIYVLQGRYKVLIKGNVLLVSERPKEERINKVIDTFLISLAVQQKDKAIGIILSGTGSDGSLGAVAVHHHGGLVFVQNPDSAEFNGMPLSAINADSPDEISTPKEIAYALLDILKEHSEVASEKGGRISKM